MPSKAPQRRKSDKRAMPASKRRVFAPRLLVVGVMLLWAAQNEPDSFTAASLSVWILSALTAGLIAYAAIALVLPVFRIIMAFIVLGGATSPDEAPEP